MKKGMWERAWGTADQLDIMKDSGRVFPLDSKIMNN